MDKLDEIIATMPDWAEWKTSGPPAGPAGGQKLKLKFGAANKDTASSTPQPDADDDDDDE